MELSFFLIARKLAPALLTGNTIVIKPSEFTPNNAIAFAKIVDEIGLPKGVFNLVLGRGETVGQELAGNPKVAMVSMTGSVGAGEKIMAAAAKNITKVGLELGGKAPAIVMDDADLELAVKAIVDSRVINTGQVCNCAERVYVQKGIYDRFVNRLGEAMKAVQFGNPAERTDIAMGPLINAAALERVEQKVARAVQEGAKVVLGGKAAEGKGYFYPQRCCWTYVRIWPSCTKRPLARCCQWWHSTPRRGAEHGQRQRLRFNLVCLYAGPERRDESH